VTYPLMKMEQKRSEMSTYKIQMLRNYTEERIQQTGTLLYLTNLSSHFLSARLTYETYNNMQRTTCLLDVTRVCELMAKIPSPVFKCGE